MPTVTHNKPARGFSLIEVLVSMLVVAVLVGLLIPVLSGARAAGYRTLCATNQRQLGFACQLYVQDNKETLPQYAVEPQLSAWKYGGAATGLASARPVLDAARPINRYIGGMSDSTSPEEAVMLFLCPGDRGVFRRDVRVASRGGLSVLPNGTCFREFGTSYRANDLLLDSTKAGIDSFARPLRMADIGANPSRLLLLGDTAWHYATRGPDDEDRAFEASWHGRQDFGNMLAIDGSTRFIDFTQRDSGEFTLKPR